MAKRAALLSPALAEQVKALVHRRFVGRGGIDVTESAGQVSISLRPEVLDWGGGGGGVAGTFHVRVEKDGGSGEPGNYFTYWLYPMTGELVEANRLNTTALMSMREWITDVKYEFRTLQGESWHFGIACRYAGGLVLLDVMGEVPASHECECGTGMPLQSSPLTEAGGALLMPPAEVT